MHFALQYTMRISECVMRGVGRMHRFMANTELEIKQIHMM